MNKKTKIVATIGPATESVEKLSELLLAGFNVMRMNFSHGDYAEHQKKIENLKKATKATGIPAAVLQDLSGPKFRIGDFYQERVILKEGSTIILTPEKIVGDETRVSLNYPTLAEELKPGNIVMVDDGKKKFEVTAIKGKEVVCKVLVGGETKGRRSVNLPGANLKISALTDKDKKDLEFGIKNDVDIIAFSFVRRPSDVVELREILNKAGSKAKICAKIETVEASDPDTFDEILKLVDMVMVARGDLAVEIGAENVPPVQKMMIKRCNEEGKPVITATQMLESMIKSPVPTRAEVSDVANAIFDGTDAVMLSEETTLGQYPVEAVKVMARVAEKTENDESYLEHMWEKRHHFKLATDDPALALTQEAVDIAAALNAKAIVALTHTGSTANLISRFKPEQPLIALTSSEKTYKQLQLSFGCIPCHNRKFKTLNEALTEMRKIVLKKKIAQKGDFVVVCGGFPFEKMKDTNMMMVEVI